MSEKTHFGNCDFYDRENSPEKYEIHSPTINTTTHFAACAIHEKCCLRKKKQTSALRTALTHDLSTGRVRPAASDRTLQSRAHTGERGRLPGASRVRAPHLSVSAERSRGRGRISDRFCPSSVRTLGRHADSRLGRPRGRGRRAFVMVSSLDPDRDASRRRRSPERRGLERAVVE
jgi:hypothetical protein